MNPITLKHNSELEPRSTEELLAVFAEFMRIEVADGMATADTIETYHRIVRDWLAWCVKSGVVPIAASRADVIRYRAEMQDSGLSVTSRQQRISIVRRFYDAAIGRGIIKANPADKVRGGRDLTPPEEKIRALTSGALQAVLAQVDTGTLAGKRDLVVLALMAIHGARRVEVQRLDHEHITHEDEPFVTFTGKGMKLRRIYLRADVYRAVREYEAAKVLSGLPGTGALFVSLSNNQRGARLDRDSIGRAVNKYFRKAGIKEDGISCHALRHTHGTEAVRGGAKLEHVQAALGHASMDTTMRYVHAVERQANNPANFIDVRLWPEEKFNIAE